MNTRLLVLTISFAAAGARAQAQAPADHVPGFVIVTGAVRKPGRVPLSAATTTVLEALAMAGSMRSDAGNDVILVRAAKAGEQRPAPIVLDSRQLAMDAGGGRILEDGDIINVPPAGRFWINGRVRNPGLYVIDIAQTVGQAIILAGGLTDRGSDRQITVTRLVAGRLTTNPAKIDDRIEPDDLITVGNRRF